MNIKTFLFATVAVLLSSSNIQAQTISKTDKVLVIYFSHTNNTKEIANQIHNATGGDIFEILPLNDYPTDYRQTTEQAKQEIKEGYKPALKSKIDTIDQYSVVFVGSPCWWSTIAPPVASFLSENNLSGKKIIPFMTHAGSGLGHSVEDIKEMLPNSTVLDGKAFWGKNAKNANDEVNEWVKGLRNE